MNYTQVIRQLKELGTENKRRFYARHGVASKTFGVSYSDLGRLKRRIHTDQGLAERLWSTGIHDAKVLATMIADPRAFDARTLDSWTRGLDNAVIADAFTTVAARAAGARGWVQRWRRSRNEWIGAVAWGVVARLALTDVRLPDSWFEERLREIEARIHGSKNRVRHTMNGALIAIAQRNGALERKAVAAARRIGEVRVDHGETACKTPNAVESIKQARVRDRWRRRARGGDHDQE
jgi:3-methyladenine DNA glycosylase AlkD